MSDNKSYKSYKWDQERFTPTYNGEKGDKYRKNYERIFAKALCQACGSPLAPEEVEGDLTDRDELLCTECDGLRS